MLNLVLGRPLRFSPGGTKLALIINVVGAIWERMKRAHGLQIRPRADTISRDRMIDHPEHTERSPDTAPRVALRVHRMSRPLSSAAFCLIYPLLVFT